MESNLPIHVKMFNDKVRVLNQTNGKAVTLSPQEARNLQAEIYDLMAAIAGLSQSTTVVTASADGGGFK